MLQERRKQIMTDIIIGGGEVGHALYHLLGKKCPVIDLDTTKVIIPEGVDQSDIGFMHVTIPYSQLFVDTVVEFSNEYSPKAIVIHSTLPVGATVRVNARVLAQIPIIYTPTRGVHSRFVADMKTYTKLWASVHMMTPFEIELFEKIWEDAGVETERWESIKDLELAKVLIDTTYYGWLIAFRQAADNIAKNYGADPDKIWEFADEIQVQLGNRPKMYSNPDGIGGHCVIPNLDLNFDGMSHYVKMVIEKINSQHRRMRPE
jgi:UDP-glucose 6-dehydrogenase